MSNYTKTVNFTAKDALPTGNPSKVVSGVDFDLEFDAIQASNNTKVDTAGSGLVVASTTLSFDINSLTAVSPVTADEFVFEDASDSTNPKKVTFGSLATALETEMNHDNLTGFVADEHVAHSGVTITAGAGLTGGGTIAATRTLDVGAGTGITVNANDVALDTASTRNTDHASITLTAGTGLSGGGTIAANRTFNLDISGLTSMTAAPVGTDSFLYNDGGTMKQMTYNQAALPSRNVSSSGNFASTDVGEIVYWTGTSGTLTMPSGVGQDDCYIVVINSGSGTLSIAGSGVTITSANSLTDIPAGGIAVLIRETSTVWFLGGSLQ